MSMELGQAREVLCDPGRYEALTVHRAAGVVLDELDRLLMAKRADDEAVHILREEFGINEFHRRHSR